MNTIRFSSESNLCIVARAFFLMTILIVCTAHRAQGQDPPLVVKQGGVTLLITESGGDVGIGITNPAHRLDVNGGDINTSDTYMIGGSTALAIGNNNTFLGKNAGSSNSSGINNTYLGREAGEQNTAGNRNTFVGVQAGEDNDGSENTFLGYRSGRNHASGDRNTFLGFEAGESNTSGTGNVFLGYKAGANETGSNKLYIANSTTNPPLIYGDFSDGEVGIGTTNPLGTLAVERSTVSGAALYVVNSSTDGRAGEFRIQNAGSGQHALFATTNGIAGTSRAAFFQGDLEITGIPYKPGGGSWVDPSDRRLKDIRIRYDRGLDALEHLNPVYYNYRQDNPLNLPSDTEYVGLIAQEVQKVIPEAVQAYKDGYLSVNNDPIIWTMLNAVKELKAENDALKGRIEALERAAATSLHASPGDSQASGVPGVLLAVFAGLLLVGITFLFRREAPRRA